MPFFFRRLLFSSVSASGHSLASPTPPSLSLCGSRARLHSGAFLVSCLCFTQLGEALHRGEEEEFERSFPPVC